MKDVLVIQNAVISAHNEIITLLNNLILNSKYGSVTLKTEFLLPSFHILLISQIIKSVVFPLVK